MRGGYGVFSFSQVVSMFILFGVMLVWLLKKKEVIKTLPPDPYDPEVDKFDLFIKPEDAPVKEETETEEAPEEEQDNPLDPRAEQ